MTIHARRFETIGFLHVSGAVSPEDIPTLKSFLDLALNLKLLVVVDLNSANVDQAADTALKTLFKEQGTLGLKMNVVTSDESWNTSKNLSQAFNLINTSEAKSVEQVLSIEEKLRFFTFQQSNTDAELMRLLQLFGKDMSSLDLMKPEDFIKLNQKRVSSEESQLTVYNESIRVLKLLDGAVSTKKIIVEKLKELGAVKAQVLAFVKLKGIS